MTAVGFEGLRKRSSFDDAQFNGFDHDSDGFEPVDGFADGLGASFDFDADYAEVGANTGIADVKDEVEFATEFINQRQRLEMNQWIKAKPESTFGLRHIGVPVKGYCIIYMGIV
jgi:hypothetical protein